MIQIIIDELLRNIVQSWALKALIVINGILKTLLNNDNADTIYTIIIQYDYADIFTFIEGIIKFLDIADKATYNRYNYKNKIDYSDLSYDEKRNFAGLFGTLSDSDKKGLINEVLNGLDYNFIVTPKEVDFQIDRLSSVISSGINGYIHGTKVSN